MAIEAMLKAWADARDKDDRRVALPPEAYTSDAMAALERSAVFAHGWIAVGHVSELAKPGDFLTFDLAGYPVLVVRDRDGVLRAFSNVCAHRSGILASGCGHKTMISCPYHAWSYDLTGKLIAAPHMDRSALGDVRLKEYRLEVWQGLVFVNLDDEAPALAPTLTGLTERLAPLGLNEQQVVMCEDVAIACNWKVLVENFCESYHVFCVHKTSLEKTTPTVTIENMEGGPGFNHHIVETNVAYAIEMARKRGVPDEEAAVSHLVCVYPSLVINLKADSATFLSVMPDGPQALRARLWQTLAPDDDRPIDDARIAAVKDAVHTFMAEDKRVIEGVQRGLAAGTGNRAPLHPWEATNWEFSHHLLRRLGVE